MQYIEIPSNKEIKHKSILLAGDSDSVNWQASLIMYILRVDLDITVINSKSNSQVLFSGRLEWESNMLAKADIVVFWITSDISSKLWTDYGVALELCKNKKKKMIVGIKGDVKNIDRIILQSQKINPSVLIYTKWKPFVENVLFTSQQTIDSSRDLSLDGFEILHNYNDEPKIVDDVSELKFDDEGHEPPVYNNSENDQSF